MSGERGCEGHARSYRDCGADAELNCSAARATRCASSEEYKCWKKSLLAGHRTAWAPHRTGWTWVRRRTAWVRRQTARGRYRTAWARHQIAWARHRTEWTRHERA